MVSAEPVDSENQLTQREDERQDKSCSGSRVVAAGAAVGLGLIVLGIVYWAMARPAGLGREDPTVPEGCELSTLRPGWVYCAGCLYEDAEVQPANMVELGGNIGESDAVRIAYDSCVSAVYSSKIFANVNATDNGNADAGVQWVGVHLGGPDLEMPIYTNEFFKLEGIKCGQRSSEDGGLWLRHDPQWSGCLFLNTVDRGFLHGDVGDEAGGCYTNMVSGKTDDEWQAFFQGTSDDEHKKMIENLVKNLLVLPLALIPELSVSAGVLFRAYAQCGSPCAQAAALAKDAIEDPKKIQGTLSGLITGGIHAASNATNYAHQEVEDTMNAANILLDVKSGILQAKLDNRTKMTNQELYFLKGQYAWDAGSSSNCTRENATKQLDDWVTQVGYIKNFHNEHDSSQGRPRQYFDQYEGICKLDGQDTWGYYRINVNSGTVDCNVHWEKHADVSQGIEELAFQIATEKFTGCPGESLGADCRVKKDDM